MLMFVGRKLDPRDMQLEKLCFVGEGSSSWVHVSSKTSSWTHVFSTALETSPAPYALDVVVPDSFSGGLSGLSLTPHIQTMLLGTCGRER